MSTPRLWSVFQAAAQSAPDTYGIAPELYERGGWDLWWRKGIRGSAPGYALSANKVPLVILSWTGQVQGADPPEPTQCRICELPPHYVLGLASVLCEYEGDVVLHCGAQHNTGNSVGSIVGAVERLGLSVAATCRPFKTYWCQDASGEAEPNRYAGNVILSSELSSRGFYPAIEGGTPTNYAGIVPISLNLWQESALRNMVNNPAARKGIAPLEFGVEHVSWVDDKTLLTVTEHVVAARRLMGYGVLVDKAITRGGVLVGEEFHESAARPLSAGISCGMTAEQVAEVWGGK